MVKGKDPAWLCYSAEFLADEAFSLMSLAERGAYFTLLLHQHLEGSIPDDLDKLAKWCGVREGFMKVIWPSIESKFPPIYDDMGNPLGRLQNPRLKREMDLRSKRSKAQSEGGKLGAKGRWGKKKRSMGKPMGKPMASQCLSSSSSSSIYNPPISPQGESTRPSKYLKPVERIVAAWNKETGGRISAPPGSGNWNLIVKRLKKERDFADRYEKAAPVFPRIDDSGWSGGEVSFHWSLRADHVDRAIGDGEKRGYKLKPEQPKQKEAVKRQLSEEEAARASAAAKENIEKAQRAIRGVGDSFKIREGK